MAQINVMLKEHKPRVKAADLARKHDVSEATLPNWMANTVDRLVQSQAVEED